MPYPAMPSASFYLTGQQDCLFVLLRAYLGGTRINKVKNSEDVNLSDFKSSNL